MSTHLNSRAPARSTHIDIEKSSAVQIQTYCRESVEKILSKYSGSLKASSPSSRVQLGCIRGYLKLCYHSQADWAAAPWHTQAIAQMDIQLTEQENCKFQGRYGRHNSRCKDGAEDTLSTIWLQLFNVHGNNAQICSYGRGWGPSIEYE